MKRLGQGPIDRDVSILRVLLGKVGLAQPYGWLPFSTYQALPYAVTTSGQELYTASLSRAIRIRAWYQGVYVAGTNDGSNYWTFTLARADTGATVTTLDTSAISAGSFENISSTGIDTDLPLTAEGLKITATKTGSPGGLYLYAPAIFVT